MKLCLFIAFTIFMGWPQFMWHLYETSEPQKKLSHEESRRATGVLKSFMDTKIIYAKEKVARGQGYTFADYFGDLWDFNSKAKEVGLNGISGSGFGIDNLQQMVTESRDKNLNELTSAKEKFEAREDDARFGASRDDVFKKLRGLGVLGLLNCLLFPYARGLLFALFLYLIWLYEFHIKDSRWEEKQQSPFPNPWRFTLLLLCYPIVIFFYAWKFFKEEGRNFAAEAELRKRRRNLFGSLSKDELQGLRRFRKNNLTLTAWKKHLESLDLKPRHCLAAALIATLIMSLVPSISQAEISPTDKKAEIVSPHGGGENHISISENDGQDHSSNQQDTVGLIVVFSLQLILSSSMARLSEFFLQLEQPCLEIFHVPLFGYSVQG